LGIGTAATANVTTSTTDTTPGKVLKVGDFGLGSSISDDLTVAGKTSIIDTLNAMGNGTGYRFSLYNTFPDRPFGAYAMGLYLVSGEEKIFCGFSSDTNDVGYIAKDSSGNTKTAKFFTTLNSQNLTISVKSISAGTASYKKGWRKLTATLPSQAGEVGIALGATTVEMVQAKVTNSDGVIVYNNDIDPGNRFYVRVNGANLILGVITNSTKVFGKTVTIYLGEEL
jgi:hypothetical protein